MADRLDASGAKSLGNAQEHPVAFLRVDSPGANLDELVRTQRPVDFAQDRVAESGGTQQDHRIEAVSAGPQGHDLGVRQFQFRHDSRL